MSLPGQPPPSPTLSQALALLAREQADEAERVVTKAAKQAKARAGSGSHPLACAYADMARFHYQAGRFKRAASEFRHASDSPLPADQAGRADRLAFMLGFAGCVEALGQVEEAERVFRQCVAFARNLYGPATPGYAAGLEPLAAFLLRTGRQAEAAQLADEAYDVLWRHGDPGIVPAVATRAAALKAVGRSDNPFADLAYVPDPLATEVVAQVLGRSLAANGVWTRGVLADLLDFVDRRFGETHPAVADTLAVVARHELGLGEKADPRVRSTAARRAIWTYAKARLPAGLLSGLDVEFEPGGAIHLVSHVARDPGPNEVVHLEAVLAQAVEDLYARPAKKPAN